MFLSTLGRAAALLTLLSLPLHCLAAASPEPAAKGLEFIENKGQWDARARYAAPLPAGRLFVEAGALTYSFVDPQQLKAHHSHGQEGGAPSDNIKGHAYTMRFVGARAGATLQPLTPTGEVRNYLLGNDRRRWAQGVGGYRELRYQGLWSGIDAHLYENRQGQLEYDFELAPRADADRIRLRYEGTDGLRLRADGALEVLTSVGQVTELAPQAWQLDANSRQQTVSCRYVLKDREVRFELGRYDHSRPLIIDPTVLFSSFTGATADNWGFTATYDQQGNMYSGGIVFSAGFPTSPGAFDTSFGGGIDMAIIKYNTASTGPASRLWATYVGGGATDTPHSLVVNNQGDLLILGTTSSGNYPVNGFDQQFGGGPTFTPLSGIPYANGSDLVVTRLSGNGATLVGSTYLGGSSNDGLLTTTGSFNQLVHNYGDQFRGDITVDADDNVYLTSSTSSQDFPMVSPAQGSHRGGLFDAVVARLTPTLSNLTWSSYFGGTGADAAYSIQLNAAREIYIAGGSTSTDLNFTAGAHQSTLFGGVDGYILRLAPSASGATYQARRATYLGTGQHDEVYFLQVDDQGGVYVLGQTRGNWPIVGNVYRNNNGRQFINKLAPDLGSVVLSTAFGTGRANPDISPTAFLVDQCERIYVCGWGGDINQGSYGNQDTNGLPTTPNAIQRTTDGNDFYLMQLAPYASSLEYATFFGGSNGEHVDGGTSRFDRRGYVYQAVCGGCGGLSNFPVPPGAGSFSTQNNASNCNNAAFKIDFSMNVASAGPNQSVCADASAVRLAGTPAGGTWTGTGVTGSAAAGYSFTPAAGLVGTHTLTYSVASTGTCVTTSTLTMTVRPVTPVVFTPLAQTCSNSSGTVRLTATPAGGTFSGPGVTGQDFSPSAAGPGNHTITYSLPAGLCGQVSQLVRVLPPPTIVAGRDTALCAFQRAGYQLRGFSPAGGTWSGTGCTPAGFFTPPATSGPVYLTYSYTDANGCTQTAQRRVMMVPEDRTNNPLNLPTCPVKPRPAEGLPFYTGMAPFTHTFDHDLLFASSYSWDFGDPESGASNTSIEQFPTHTYAKPGIYNIKLTAYYNSSCQSTTRFAPVYVGNPFIPNIITPNGDGQNDVFEQRLSCLPVAIKVFSRWGNKVYESQDYQNNWAGASTESGDGKLPDGIYYYHLTDTEGRTAKGWLEIRR